jgi:F-type H+-transporting ATPase subunit a
MSANSVVASTDIKIGEHVTVQVFGLTLNIDTIWTTAIAGLIVIGLGLWVRSKATSGVPSKIQVFWETIVEQITTLVEGNLGRVNPYVVQLAVALFLFILVSNWLELIPSGEDPHLLPAPTADVNLTYALALLVIVGVHTHSVRERGVKSYSKHYFEPYPILFPLILIEEIVKPFTLALRLFGNIFSGAIMIALIGLLPLWSLWGPNAIWKLFDLFIGLIQAFIFALLTILYFGMAGESHGGGGQDSSSSTGSSEPGTTQPDSEKVPEAVH